MPGSPSKAVILLLAWTLPCFAEKEVNFARDIRPILSDTCYHCHGPDEATREAELRLDTREGLFRTDGDVTVVSPSHPEASELIRRIVSDDPDEKMPPPDSQRSLTAEQINLLRSWVESGAAWEGHWSFQPIVRPPVPPRSEEHTSELQSQSNLVCRLLLEKKK